MDKKAITKKNRPNLKRLITILSFIGYVFCVALLIFESCLNGDISSGQSNYVGEGIANTVNSVTGDASQLIELNSLSIDNKITEAEPGDTLNLSVKFSPEDTSYKSLKYSSIDYDDVNSKALTTNEVASIDSDGLVTFLKPGYTRIDVASSTFSKIKDGFVVEVKDVYPTSLSTSIEGADLYDGIYRLYYGRKYSVTLSYKPMNSTQVETIASYDSDSYFSYDDTSNVLSANKVTNGTKTITFKNSYDQTISSTISFEIKYENYVPVSSIDLKGDLLEASSIYVGQTIVYSITISPSDASDKSYSIEFDKTYLSGFTTFIKGKKNSEGIAKTIKIYSNDNPNIFVRKEITVDPAPLPISFSLNISASMVVGTTQKISLKDINPGYADTSKVVYTSSNTNVVEVDDETLNAISSGEATITANIDGITASSTTTVIEKQSTGTLDDYYVTIVSNFGPVLTDTSYNIPKLFSFYTDQDATSSLADSYLTSASYTCSEESVDIVGSYWTFLTATQYHVSIFIEGIEKLVTIPVYPYYEVYHDDSTAENILNESSQTDTVRYYVGDTFAFTVNPSDEDTSFTYVFSLKDDQNLLSYSFDKKRITMTANKAGKVTLTIDQYYKGTIVSGNSKSYDISIYDIYATGFTIKYYNYYKGIADDPVIVTDDVGTDYKLYCYIDRVQKLELTPTNGTSLTPTGCSFSIKSSDESIISIDDAFNIHTYSIGSARIKITMRIDEDDFITREFIFIVQNVIKVDTDNPFTVVGKNVSYDENSDTYSMMNGYEGSFKLNFLESSTYTTTTYTSSDESVAIIGDDGVITPLTVGDTKLTATCWDGISTFKVDDSINLHIDKKDLISDMSNFFYYVRKGIGHFGAFFVFGIFSSIFYMLYFDKKRYYIAILLNFFIGFNVACITEFIQLYVPGRTGLFTDVLIDFTGFSLSSAIVIVTFLALAIVGYFLKKKKLKTI